MKYMLLMWGDGTDSGIKAAAKVCETGWMPWVREMQERGVVLHGGGVLASAGGSAVVRVSGSEVLVADGPCPASSSSAPDSAHVGQDQPLSAAVSPGRLAARL